MEIKSVSDFIAKCFRNPLLRGKEYAVFYRGVNTEYPRETRHLPGLYYPPNNFYEKEDEIFKEVISVFPDEMLAQKLTVEKLILMEHYGFPTRIMDISKNPITALFFACFADKGQENSAAKDGIVYVYAVPKSEIKFCESDSVSILANLCKRPSPFTIKAYMHLSRDDFNDVEELEYLVYDIQEEKPHFQPLITPQTINSVICLRPRMNNPRIIRQDGYFFLFGINGEKKKPSEMPREWIKDPIVISANAKKDILAELDTMDINEGYVYPDFQHISEVIRKRYGKNQLTGGA